MTLKDAQVGKRYRIEKLMLDQPIKQRLESMGLIEGTNVRKINEVFDGSIIFMVRGTRLAIGKDLAEQIGVCSDSSSCVNDDSCCRMKRRRMRGRSKNE